MIKLRPILESINKVSKQEKWEKILNFIGKKSLDEDLENVGGDTATFNMNNVSYNGQPLQGVLTFYGYELGQQGNTYRYNSTNQSGWQAFNTTIQNADLNNYFNQFVNTIRNKANQQNIPLNNNIENYLNSLENPQSNVIDALHGAIDITQNIDIPGDDSLVKDLINKSLSKSSEQNNLTWSKNYDVARHSSCNLLFNRIHNINLPSTPGIYFWSKSGLNNLEYVGITKNINSIQDEYNTPTAAKNPANIFRKNLTAPNPKYTRIGNNGIYCTRILNGENDLVFYIAQLSELNEVLNQNPILNNLINQYDNVYSTYNGKGTIKFFEDLLMWYYTPNINIAGRPQFPTNDFTRLNQQNEVTRFKKLAGL